MKPVSKLLLLSLCMILLASLAVQTLAKPDYDRCDNDHDHKDNKIIKVFFTTLKGNEEVPPVETRASGFAIFALSKDRKTLFYLLHVNKIENTTASHIHVGAKGVNGPVVAFLFGPSLIPGKFSGVLAKGAITADDLVGPLEGMTLHALLKEIKDGNTYVNVHTTQNPGGEIRGQI